VLSTRGEPHGHSPNLVELREQGVGVEHAAVRVDGKDIGLPRRERLLGDDVPSAGQVSGQSLIQGSNTPSHIAGVVERNNNQQEQETDVRREGEQRAVVERVAQVQESEVRERRERQHVVEDEREDNTEGGGVGRTEVVDLWGGGRIWLGCCGGVITVHLGRVVMMA
jgi:hypothetical protein